MEIVILLIVIATIVYYLVKTKFLSLNASDSILDYSSKGVGMNDKLVLIENISGNEVDEILNVFCETYRHEVNPILPRLYQINDKQFVVTFPYDLGFEIFCFFVNYVCYPKGFDKNFSVVGWTTTKRGDKWITEQIMNKKVMLYIPPEDDEYDNVYMTTEDNIGYKLGFASNEEQYLLDAPKRLFVSPPIELNDLTDKDYKEHNDYK